MTRYVNKPQRACFALKARNATPAPLRKPSETSDTTRTESPPPDSPSLSRFSRDAYPPQGPGGRWPLHAKTPPDTRRDAHPANTLRRSFRHHGRRSAPHRAAPANGRGSTPVRLFGGRCGRFLRLWRSRRIQLGDTLHQPGFDAPVLAVGFALLVRLLPKLGNLLAQDLLDGRSIGRLIALIIAVRSRSIAVQADVRRPVGGLLLAQSPQLIAPTGDERNGFPRTLNRPGDLQACDVPPRCRSQFFRSARASWSRVALPVWVAK